MCYEQLFIQFKNGEKDYYSPIDTMKLSREGNTLEISYFGTLEIFKDTIQLDDVEEILLETVNEEDYTVESDITMFNDSIDDIIEFDNLNNSTYGILRAR
ncbi:MAG: hypothetical protein ACRCTZ_21450 [Sarcina sp.]